MEMEFGGHREVGWTWEELWGGGGVRGDYNQNALHVKNNIFKKKDAPLPEFSCHCQEQT